MGAAALDIRWYYYLCEPAIADTRADDQEVWSGIEELYARCQKLARRRHVAEEQLDADSRVELAEFLTGESTL